MADSWITQPDSELFKTALTKSYPEIIHACIEHPDLNDRLCQNEDFWKQKYRLDFGEDRTSTSYRSSAPFNNSIDRYHLRTSVWTIGQIINQLQRKKDKDKESKPQILAKADQSVRISAGGRHILTLTSQGQVYGLGENSSGQLGLPGLPESFELTEIMARPFIQEISAGHSHSLSLDNDGRVWGWGDNQNGQLGLSGGITIQDSPTLLRIPGLTEPIRQVQAGHGVSLVVSESGRVWAAGRNDKGQLGLGWTNSSQKEFTQVPYLYQIVQVATGRDHTLALSQSGTVYGFGRNDKGQLGINNKIDRYDAVEIAGLSSVVRIAAGFDHSLAIINSQRDKGQVYGWGDNQSQQLGSTNPKEVLTPHLVQSKDATEISGGHNFSLILLSTGELLGVGTNQHGALGLAEASVGQPVPILAQISQIAAGPDYTLALGHNARTRTTYQGLSKLFREHRVDRYRTIYLPGTTNVDMLVYDRNGQPYIAIVQYDPQTNQIFEPI